MKTKLIPIIITLVITICIFIFLKSYKVSPHTIPALTQESVQNASSVKSEQVSPITGCDIIKMSNKSAGNGAYQTFVTIKNNTGKLIRNVTVDVVFYDNTNEVIGVGIGIAENINEGNTRVVNCLAVNIFNPSTYTAEISDIGFY
jgi:hypothetical protein